jgi:hypothetical protein
MTEQLGALLISQEASLLLLIALGLIAEICLVLAARDTWRVLRRQGARPIGLGLAAGACSLAAASPFVYFFVWIWQPWLDAALLLPFIALYFFPGRLISITGGPTRLRQLWVALITINNRWELLFQDEAVLASDAEWLAARSAELNGLRTPESQELIDLWQEQISDRLTAEDQEAYLARSAPRNTRINELQSVIFSQFYWPGWDSVSG